MDPPDVVVDFGLWDVEGVASTHQQFDSVVCKVLNGIVQPSPDIALLWANHINCLLASDERMSQDTYLESIFGLIEPSLEVVGSSSPDDFTPVKKRDGLCDRIVSDILTLDADVCFAVSIMG